MKKSELQNLDSLFCQLAEGQPPNFFQMMSALSDISTIWPDTVISPQDRPGHKKSGPPDTLYPNFQPRCVGGNCG